MATFTEESVTRVSRVTEHGVLEVQREDKVLKDGIEVSKTYHRTTVNPGDDLNGMHPTVVAAARAVWTPENVGQHSAKTVAAITEAAAKQAELDDANEAIAQREAQVKARQDELAQAEAALASRQAAVVASIASQGA